MLEKEVRFMKYLINIVENNGNVYCTLDKVQLNQKNIEFDISTIIGDFLTIKKLTYTAEKIPKFIYEYSKHIFTNDNETISSFDIEKIKDTFLAVDKILDMPKGISSLNLIKFEELKHLLNLSFYYTVSTNATPNENIPTFETQTLDSLLNDEKKDKWFTYYCNSITDLVFAILHYYIISHYKLSKCNHCGLYFATKTLKQKYCNRLSPYIDIFSQKKSTPTNCEQTVRNIKQQLMRKRNRISNKIIHSNNYSNGQTDFYYEFQDKCYEYKKLIDEISSIENLQKYNEYLNQIESEKRWLVK